MKEIISKELLSEVLELDIIQLNIDEEVSYTFFVGVKPDNNGNPYEVYEDNYINIHELAHKCKEWAIEQGYIIQIMPFCILVLQIENSMEQVFRYEKEDMENQKPYLPEYEFKACQWILENKEK